MVTGSQPFPQNSRNSLLRAGRESEDAQRKSQITQATDALGRQIEALGQWSGADLAQPGALDGLRGVEGMGSATYFGVLSLTLK